MKKITEAVKRRPSESIRYYESVKVSLDFDCLSLFLNEVPHGPLSIKPTNSVQQNLIGFEIDCRTN